MLRGICQSGISPVVILESITRGAVSGKKPKTKERVEFGFSMTAEMSIIGTTKKSMRGKES